METKELKEFRIVVPDEYEIDKNNSTFERIVFKKKADRPRSWEEFCSRGFTGDEAYISCSGAVEARYEKGYSRWTSSVGYVDNIKEAEAFVALMQLRQLRKSWVGDWEPDWLDDSSKCIISMERDYITILVAMHIRRSLSFPTREMAEEFIECFKELLEQAKMVL